MNNVLIGVGPRSSFTRALAYEVASARRAGAVTLLYHVTNYVINSLIKAGSYG